MPLSSARRVAPTKAASCGQSKGKTSHSTKQCGRQTPATTRIKLATALEDLQSPVANKNVCLTPSLVLQVNLGIQDGCATHFEL